MAVNRNGFFKNSNLSPPRNLKYYSRNEILLIHRSKWISKQNTMILFVKLRQMFFSFAVFFADFFIKNLLGWNDDVWFFFQMMEQFRFKVKGQIPMKMNGNWNVWVTVQLKYAHQHHMHLQRPVNKPKQRKRIMSELVSDYIFSVMENKSFFSQSLIFK